MCVHVHPPPDTAVGLGGVWEVVPSTMSRSTIASPIVVGATLNVDVVPEPAEFNDQKVVPVGLLIVLNAIGPGDPPRAIVEVGENAFSRAYDSVIEIEDVANVTVSPKFTVLVALNVPNQRRTGVAMVSVTLVAPEPVMAADITA